MNNNHAGGTIVGGGTNSDETDAQMREECGKLEMDVLLKVVCDKAKEAIKVLATLKESPAAHTLSVELSLKVCDYIDCHIFPIDIKLLFGIFRFDCIFFYFIFSPVLAHVFLSLFFLKILGYILYVLIYIWLFKLYLYIP